MRVCHVWHNFYPIEFGGVEKYILNLSNFLAEENINNKFLLLTDKAAYVPLSRSIRISSHEKFANLDIYRLSPNLSSFLRGAVERTVKKSNPRLDKVLAFNLFRQATRIHGIEDVDVYHVHGIWKSLYPNIGVSLSEYFGKPFIVTLHGDSVNPYDPYSMPLRSPEVLGILEKASAITAYAQQSCNLLTELGLGQKTKLVPNFVNTRIYRRPKVKVNQKSNRILMVTRLTQSKDPLTPILAFPEIVKQIPNATFKIVGYGSLFNEAKELIHKLGIEQSVSLLGMKSNVRDYLWDSDIFIANRGGYMSALEAWSAGLAVVSPGFGVMKDLISDNLNGLLVEPGNVTALANAVINLMTDRELFSKIAQNGILAADKLDVSIISHKIEAIYKQAINSYKNQLIQSNSR